MQPTSSGALCISMVDTRGGGPPALGHTAGQHGQEEMDGGSAVFSGTHCPKIT